MKFEPNTKVALLVQYGDALIPLVETVADEDGNADLAIPPESREISIQDDPYLGVVVQVRSLTSIKIHLVD